MGGGNTKGTRRRFGAVRKLPSSRWQARYLGPDDIMRPAYRTFATKTEAERWLTRTGAEIIEDSWVDPDAGRVPLGEYAGDWIEERPGLRPKTVQLYRFLLGRHLVPAFGRVAVADIREAQVRRWRKNLLDTGVTAVTAAKAYRLLRAVMNTAADDALIRRNPCRLRGAGQERSPERPVLTLRQVLALTEAIGARYRALILLAVFGSLGWAELAALRRRDIDLEARTVRIFRQLAESPGGGFTFGPPKSAAGQRTVAFPDLIVPDPAWHLARFAGPEDDSLLLTSPARSPMRNSDFRRRVWRPALAEAGLTDLHFHDLRHAGNVLAAAAGANLRELMERMGHSTTRAAIVCLHSTDERQGKVADALGDLARAELGDDRKRGTVRGPSGTDLARKAARGSR
jgi:integrase